MSTERTELESLRTALARWKSAAVLLALLLVIWVAAVLSISRVTSPPDYSVEVMDVADRAAEAVRIGDYVTAVALLSDEAEQGHAVAQYMLGQLYASGLGVKQDYRVAHQWFKRAAEQGEPNAQYALASMYAYGQGVVRDDAKAAMWSIRARDRGYGAVAAAQQEKEENQ